MRTIAIMVVCLLGSSGALAKGAPAPPNFGARPDWEQFKTIAEAAIRDRLVDPDSAKFLWPYLAKVGTLKEFLQSRVSGYYTCGTLNSRNKMGGFAGSSFVLVMERDGVPVMVSIGKDEPGDLANVFCEDQVAKHLLPLVPLQTTSVPAPAIADLAAGTPRLGMGFAAVPEGLYVALVVPDGAAAKAHLKAGMVVTALNGIPIKGVPYLAAVGMIRAAPSPIVLSIVGVGEVKISKEP
jgi:hypothetical protein